jgi:hypothetical protein
LHPWFEQFAELPLSWSHDVIVPVHVVVPGCQTHPLVHVAAELNVLHSAGTPEQLPPTPLSYGVHVHPSATQGPWLFATLLLRRTHALGLPVHAPAGVTGVQPWHSLLPQSDTGHPPQVV